MEKVFEKAIEQIRRHYGLAGGAFVAVKNGRVVAKECFGYADIEQKRPITTRSFFDIASCSKAFTTFLGAQLCDEGKMDWDLPVRTWYPGFRMMDEYAAAHLTPRDMACHRSGLSRHDLVRRGVLTDRADYVSRIAYYPLSAGFREKMQYQNQIYAALGYAEEQITGQTWEEMVTRRIAEPLGMEIGFRGISDLAGLDAALPYAEDHGVPRRASYNMCCANNPCGGIKTNIDSLEHWVMMLAQHGEYQGKRLISEAQYQQLKKPNIYMGEIGFNQNDKQRCYALGWMPSVYQGRRLVSHGGSIEGFNSNVGFFPDERSGYAVCVNTNGSGAQEILKYMLCDLLSGDLKADYTDLVESYHDHAVSMDSQVEHLEKLPVSAEEKANAVGHYYNDGYHDLYIVENQEGGLRINYADVHADLYKSADGRFLGWFEAQGVFADVRFDADHRGAVISLSEAYSPSVFKKLEA
ncbi:serine hydrolase domain-containing protein [Acidaminobacterium chupaoyuni]